MLIPITEKYGRTARYLHGSVLITLAILDGFHEMRNHDGGCEVRSDVISMSHALSIPFCGPHTKKTDMEILCTLQGL